MKKGTFVADTFEKAKDELIKPTAKGMADALQNTFSPAAIIEQTLTSSSTNNTKQEQEKNLQKKGATPLNFDKLQTSYKDQDNIKAETLKRNYFQRVKSEEENIFEKNKQEKKQLEQKELYEKQQKERQLREQEIRNQQQTVPHGKERRSIFSHKKVAKREQVEVRPASGKQ